jgi:PmbA protein
LPATFPNLDLYHPWDLPVDAGIDLATRCEAAALAVDPRVTNSEGATVSAHESDFIYANSSGFTGGYRTSRHGMSCSVIAETTARCSATTGTARAASPASSRSAESVGSTAGIRSIRRLNARKITTAHRAGALRGADRVGTDRPFRRRSQRRQPVPEVVASCSTASAGPCSRRTCDQRAAASAARRRQRAIRRRGCRDADRDVSGRHRQRLFSRAAIPARKLGMATDRQLPAAATNLLISHVDDDWRRMLRRMGDGPARHRMLGKGVNTGTGDYSRGAAGLLGRKRAIAYPVEEIHDRRQPLATCSGGSWRSGTTSTGAGRSRPDRSSLTG